MSIVIQGIFSGVLFFYLTYFPVWVFSNSPTDAVEKLEVRDYVTDLPDVVQETFELGQAISDYYNEDELIEILEDREDVSDLKVKLYGQNPTYGFVELKFILSQDILVSISFRVQKATLFPPQMTSLAIPFSSTIEVAGDEYKLSEIKSLELLREMLRNNKPALLHYVHSLSGS